MKLRRTRGFILLPLLLLIIPTESSHAGATNTGNTKQSEAWTHKPSRIGSKTSISTQAVAPESHQSTTSAASQTRAKIPKIFSNPEKVQIKQVANNDVRRKIQKAKLSHHESVSASQSKPSFESQHPDPKIDTQNHLKRNHQNKRYLPIFLVRNGAVNLTRESGLSVELPKKEDHSIENGESLELKSNVHTLPSLSNFEPLTILKNVGSMVPRTIRKAHDEDTKQQSENPGARDQSRYLKKSTRIQTRAEEGSPDSKSASPGPEDLRRHELSGNSQKQPTRRVVRLRYKSQSKQTSDDSGSNPESGHLTTTQFPEQTKKESRRGPGRALLRSPATSTEKPISTAERAEHNPPDIKPTIPSSPSRRLNLNTKQTSKTFETTSKEPPELGNNSDAKKFSKSPSRYRDNLNRTKSDLSSTGMPVPRLRTSSKFGIQAQNPVLVMTIPVPTTNFPTNKPEPSSRPASKKDAGIDRNDGDGDFELVNSSLRRRASKEDFFNHGLGFRGRRPSPTGTPEAPAPTTLPIPTFSTATPVPATTGNPTVASRVSPGWTLRRRPDYSRGASSTDHSASLFESTAASGLIDDQTKLTTAASSKNLRRGNKTFVASSDGQTKAKDGDDSDNYPAEFKARLGQPEKNGEKSRTNPETSKALSAAEAFAARSKMKLENARKLIKPELLIDESKAHHVFVELPDSAVEEGQNVYKLARKANLADIPQLPSKSDWKPKGKGSKATLSSVSRYKQNAVVSKANTAPAPDPIKPPRFGPSVRPREAHRMRGGPKADQQQQQQQPDRGGREADVRAVVLKLRKSMEALGLGLGSETSGKGRPPRRSDSPEQSSTTLLTTMRTVRSFSFSTRLARPDEDSPPATTTTQRTSPSATTDSATPVGTSVATMATSAKQLLINDARGQPVFVVYPSATEGPFSAKPISTISAYKNTNSANSLPRPSLNGLTPKFSARYKSAEIATGRPTSPTNSREVTEVSTKPSTEGKHPSDKLILMQKVEETTKFKALSNGNNQYLTREIVSRSQNGHPSQTVHQMNDTGHSHSLVSSTIMSLIRNSTKAAMTTVPSIQTTTVNSPVPTKETEASSRMTTTMQPTPRPTIPPTKHPILPAKSSSMALASNAFGTTFDDLAFLNALLEKPNPSDATPRTLSEVEQMLANKILSLALGKTATNDASTRSPKAIETSLPSPNVSELGKNSKPTTSSSDLTSSTSKPVIQPSSTRDSITDETITASWKTNYTTTVSKDSLSTLGVSSTVKPSISSTMSSSQSQFKAQESTNSPLATSRGPVTTVTPARSTTKATVVITARPATTKRAKATTQQTDAPPFAFAANFLQRIFGRNPFTRPTTQRPATIRRQKSTTPLGSSTTAKYTPSTSSKVPDVYIVHAESSLTPRSVPFPHDVETKSKAPSTTVPPTEAADQVVTVTPKSSGKHSSSTFSPEDDARFLAALLKHTQGADRFAKSASELVSSDEEILRALLSDENKIQNVPGKDDQEELGLSSSLLKNKKGESFNIPDSTSHPPQQQQTTPKEISTTAKTTMSTTTKPTKGKPSTSTYPAPLFRNFLYSGANESEDSSDENEPRNQIIDSAIGMTRAFSRFIGSVIMGATQRFQTFLKNRNQWT